MCDTTMQEMGLPDRPVGMTNTIELLERFKKGDEEAVSLLVERSIPPLKRWEWSMEVLQRSRWTSSRRATNCASASRARRWPRP